MLERERQAAGLRVDAEARRLADPVRERDVEHLHVHLADVAPHPLLEDVDQEAAVLLRGHRAARDPLSLLHVQRAVAPGRPGHRTVGVGLGDALDDGDELDEARAALVAQEAVHLAAVIGVRGVDRRQRVPLDSSGLQVLETAPSPGRTSPCRPCSRGRRRGARAARRSRSRRGSRSRRRTPPTPRRAACRSSGSCRQLAAPASGTGLQAQPSDGRSRRPSASARRPATRSSPPARARAPRSAAGRTPRAARPPSGSASPGRASPSRGRSSRSSRGCRQPRSASRAGGRRGGASGGASGVTAASVTS